MCFDFVDIYFLETHIQGSSDISSVLPEWCFLLISPMQAAKNKKVNKL